MKSKILIDVDYDNQPIIKIEYQNSEDVRDKLVKRFLEAFGGQSAYASFYFVDAQPHEGQRAMVRPIPPDLLTMNTQIMAQAAEHYERNYRPVKSDADYGGVHTTESAVGIPLEK